MNTSLPSHKVPLTLVADIITFISEKPKAKNEDIMEYTGRSKSYVNSGLKIAKMLDIIDENIITGYSVDKDAKNALGITPNNDMKINVMRRYIQNYEPFIIFVKLCINGNSISDSARKIYTLYDFEGKDYIMLQDLFLAWGTTTNIFTINSNKIILSKEINTELNKTELPFLSLDSDMAIRLYIINRLGEEISATMDPVDINELTDAFKKYTNDPRDAIACAGRAFENYLRRIANNLHIDVAKLNGITQIINIIYSNKKIHNKQNSIGSAIGTIRNMSGHGVDPKELEPWTLKSESALAYIEIVLSTISSINIYLDNNTLKF